MSKSTGVKCLHLGPSSSCVPLYQYSYQRKYQKHKTAACCLDYSQVTVDESIDLRHVLTIDSSQNNYEENHHKRRKAPAQKAKEQVSPLSVLITHHQHVPEVHRLGKEEI